MLRETQAGGHHGEEEEQEVGKAEGEAQGREQGREEEAHHLKKSKYGELQKECKSNEQ